MKYLETTPQLQFIKEHVINTKNITCLPELEIQRDSDTSARLILNQYADVFSDRVSSTKVIKYDIFLESPNPIAFKPYPNMKET